MDEQQERHYNIPKLNRIFAIASLVLLFTIIWMFASDYSREWKEYQRAFRNLEIEKTRVRYDAEINKLKKQPEFQALQEKLQVAQKEIATQHSNLIGVQEEIKNLETQNSLLTQEQKLTRSVLDATKYEYEEALRKDPEHASIVGKQYDDLEKKIANLKLAVEQSDANLSTKQKTVDDSQTKLKELEKEEKTLTKQISILERKLKKIDPDQMSVANLVADLIRDQPIIDFANPNYKIEQIVLKDIKDDVVFMEVPKVDRCTTCHMGIANPDYKNAPQPFTTHPHLELFVAKDSPHPLDEFGCTVCHGGRGRGTDFISTAHKPSSDEQKKKWEAKYHWHDFKSWEKPMYPMPYVEAGCFQCHAGQTTIKGAEKLNLGLQLIEKSGCYACHLIDKYKEWPKPGPDLTHLPSKTTKEWTYHWLQDPKSFRHNTWMPSFFNQSNSNDAESLARSEQEIHAIVQYLFEKSTEFSLGNMPTWGDPKKGEEIVASLGCFACHQIQPEKSKRDATRQALRREHGPNLIGLGTKTTKVWLYNWLKDPNRYHPETRMPNLRLTDEETADAAAYLVQNEVSDFNNTAIPAVNEMIIDKIVQDFLGKTATQDEAKAQIAKMSLDEKLTMAGGKLIAHYGCYSCHTIKGFENVKPIGTELTQEGSKPAEKLDFGFIDMEHSPHAWFTQKLKDPRIFDRGKIKAPDEKLRMPNYNFSDEETEAIVTAILGFVKDAPESKIKPRTAKNLSIEEGQKIIRQFNCQGCHIIEGEGGAIQPAIAEWLVKFDNRTENEAQSLVTSVSPPNLVGEGKKVQSEWLFNFLHQPLPIRPWLKVRMPTYHFNATHLNALVKYFSALDGQDTFTEKADHVMPPEEFTAGEKLFSKDYFDCAQCHIVGDKLPSGSSEKWAPNFALARTRLRPEWIIEWIKNPQALLPGTKMPNFYDPQNFDSSGPEDILKGDENQQIRVLRDYILTLSGSEGKLSAPAQPTTPTQPANVSKEEIVPKEEDVPKEEVVPKDEVVPKEEVVPKDVVPSTQPEK